MCLDRFVGFMKYLSGSIATLLFTILYIMESLASFLRCWKGEDIKLEAQGPCTVSLQSWTVFLHMKSTQINITPNHVKNLTSEWNQK